MRADESKSISDLKTLFKAPGATVLSRPDIDAYIISILKELNIPFRRCFMEADTGVVDAVRSGEFRYAYSTDGDLLILGATDIITRIDWATKTATVVSLADGDTESWEALSRLLLGDDAVDGSGLLLTRKWLVVLSNFVGNDFLPGLKQVGLVTAVELLKTAMTGGSDGLDKVLMSISRTREYHGRYGSMCQGKASDFVVRFWRAYNIHMHPPVLRRKAVAGRRSSSSSQPGQTTFRYAVEPLTPFPSSSQGWDGDRMLSFSPIAAGLPYVGNWEKFYQGGFSRILNGAGEPVDIEDVALKQPRASDGAFLPFGCDLNVRGIHPKFHHRNSLRIFLACRKIHTNKTDTDGGVTPVEAVLALRNAKLALVNKSALSGSTPKARQKRSYR